MQAPLPTVKPLIVTSTVETSQLEPPSAQASATPIVNAKPRKARPYDFYLFIAVAIVLLLAAAIYASVRWVLLPDLHVIHPQIEAKLSEALKQPVKLEELQLRWDGPAIEAQLRQLTLGAAEAPELHAQGISTRVAFFPLLAGIVSTERITVETLSFTVQQKNASPAGGLSAQDKSKDGKNQAAWFVAGQDMQAKSDGAALEWLLTQPSLSAQRVRVQISDAQSRWLPEGKRTLALEKFSLLNSGRQHTLSLQDASPAALKLIQLITAANASRKVSDKNAGLKPFIYSPDPRLGSAFSLKAVVQSSQLGRRADASLWEGELKLSLPQLHPIATVSWLAGILDKNTALQEWSDWGRTNPRSDTIAAQTTLNFKPKQWRANGQVTGSPDTGVQDVLAGQRFDWRWGWMKGQGAQGRHTLGIASQALDLSKLSSVLAGMPLSAPVRNMLNDAQAQGSLEQPKAGFSFGSQLDAAVFSAQAKDLGLAAFEYRGAAGVQLIPAARGITGDLAVQYSPLESTATLNLDSQEAWLELPRQFEPAKLDFENLSGQIRTRLSPQALSLDFEQLAVKNIDFSGVLSGSYSVALAQTEAQNVLTTEPQAVNMPSNTSNNASNNPSNNLGRADITGSMSRANLAQLHRYMPISLPSGVRAWLRHAIVQGEGKDLKFELKGALNQFPFASAESKAAGEVFKLQTQIEGGQMNLNPVPAVSSASAQGIALSKAAQPAWPLIHDIRGKLSLDGYALSLADTTGHVLTQALNTASISVPTSAQTSAQTNTQNTTQIPNKAQAERIDILLPSLVIADLREPAISMQIQAKAPITRVLGLAQASPMGGSLAGANAAFNAQLNAAIRSGGLRGDLSVDSQIQIFPSDTSKNQLQGSLSVADGYLQLSPELPPLSQIQASATFTQHTLKVKDAQAQWLGGAVAVSGTLDTRDTNQDLRIQGRANLANIQQFSPNPMTQALLQRAQGQLDYAVALGIKPAGLFWQVQGELKDTALTWPGVINKAAGTPMSFALSREPSVSKEKNAPSVQKDLWNFSLLPTEYGPLTGQIERQWQARGAQTKPAPNPSTSTLATAASAMPTDSAEAGVWLLTRGAVALGAGAELNSPDSGVAVTFVTPQLNIDRLRAGLEQLPWRDSAASSKPALALAAQASAYPNDSAAFSAWVPTVIAVNVGDLTVANRKFKNIVGAAFRSDAANPTSSGKNETTSTWSANLVAQGINGYITWTQGQANPSTVIEPSSSLESDSAIGTARVTARLTELNIPSTEAKSAATGILDINPREVPAVDLIVDKLIVGDKLVGKLSLKASNQRSQFEQGRRNWVIESAQVIHPQFELNAKGSWQRERSDAKPLVRLDLDGKSASLGDLLNAVGAPGLIAAAPLEAKASLQWTGSPFQLDVPSLSGSVDASLGKGQFLKVDPGAGRLVGLFSLQSLPKRLSLDFSDMFSKGFAFDKVATQATISTGELNLDNFKMTGLAADVSATGKISLNQETQDLRFVVRPDVNAGNVSLLYILINPPIGLGTLALQYLFREPIRNSLTVEYAITGSWAAPVTAQVKRAIE